MKLSILLVLFGISQVFGGIHGRNFGGSVCRAAWCDVFLCGFEQGAPPDLLQDLICFEGLPISFHTLYHGRLYRWTEISFPFFLYLKPVEISKKYFNTI